MKINEQQREKLNQFVYRVLDTVLFDDDFDEIEKILTEDDSIPIEPPVMQKIAESWISVDDKLPTGDLISEWVLVCYEPMGCGELIRNLGWYDGKWWLDSKTLLEEWEIKYWMPLPELPIDDSNFSA